MRIGPVNHELTGQSSQLFDDWKREDWPVNTGEWCEDAWDPEFYSKPESREKDPLCTPEKGTPAFFRGVRGGSWVTDAGGCRSVFRGRAPSVDRGIYLGFRPSWSVRE